MSPRVDLPAMEREVLEFWADRDIFDRSLAQTENGPTWVVYEGPPTANGVPGTHHIEARVFKDIFPRFKTMQGTSYLAKPVGTATGFPLNSLSKRNSDSTASGTSRRTGSQNSTRSAANPSSAMWEVR